MLIDNTNDKVASEEEKAIWKILDDYNLNPMLQPNCADEIIALVNKLFIQRVVVPKVTLCEGDIEFAKDGCTCAVGICFKEGHN